MIKEQTQELLVTQKKPLLVIEDSDEDFTALTRMMNKAQITNPSLQTLKFKTKNNHLSPIIILTGEGNEAIAVRIIKAATKIITIH